MADCGRDTQAATIAKHRELLVAVVALKNIANAPNSARIIILTTWTPVVKRSGLTRIAVTLREVNGNRQADCAPSCNKIQE